jgi:phosphoribosylaminoimidazole-succinocarboxamide synthase
MSQSFEHSGIIDLPMRQGKVRDIYDLGDKLLLVATDRISAFDWVLPTPIPDKGRVLNLLSAFWFDIVQQPHHCLSIDIDSIMQQVPVNALRSMDRSALAGRCMLVKKAQPILIECVVRGYLEGSGFKEYKADGTVCGIKLPSGLVQCSKLPEPIFTPATKEQSGHDINISFERMGEIVGTETAEELRRLSLAVYQAGAAYALGKGIIIADTKFEWGRWHDQLILIDEVLTPDSSRFWPADQFEPGHAQLSFDKQFVREWLEQSSGWDKNSRPPELPPDIIARTRDKYVEAYELLTDKTFQWK